MSVLVSAALTLAAGSAGADNDGLLLPAPPRGPGGEDSISTSSGVRCRQSLNTNGPYLDLGVAGSHDFEEDEMQPLYSGKARNSGFRALGYARVIIPLGEKPKRIDCSRIFELEIIRLRREIEMLEAGLE